MKFIQIDSNVFFFFFQIVVSLSCCYNDPVFEMPITIGTNPINDNDVPGVQNINAHNNIQVNGMSISNSSANVITQQPTASQQPNQSNLSAQSYPSTSTAPHPLVTEGKIFGNHSNNTLHVYIKLFSTAYFCPSRNHDYTLWLMHLPL